MNLFLMAGSKQSSSTPTQPSPKKGELFFPSRSSKYSEDSSGENVSCNLGLLFPGQSRCWLESAVTFDLKVRCAPRIINFMARFVMSDRWNSSLTDRDINSGCLLMLDGNT